MTDGTNMYMCQANSTNFQTKTFVHTEQILWTTETNMCTCQTNSINGWNKKLYVPNKLYKLKEQIIEVEQILHRGDR
jgi:hypothetical protein